MASWNLTYPILCHISKKIGIKGFDFADKTVIDERGETQRNNFHELLSANGQNFNV